MVVREVEGGRERRAIDDARAERTDDRPGEDVVPVMDCKKTAESSNGLFLSKIVGITHTYQS